MDILYIHQYFKTPQEPGGTRSYWIAKELVSHGHNVVMVTTSNTIKENKEVKFIDGIKVIYFKVMYDQKMNILKRVKSFLDFMIKSTREGFRISNIDLVISTSTPLTVGLPALLLKKRKGIPYIFEVRDLWPEVPIQMGGLKNPLLKFIARKFEKSIYKNATHIIALSPGMAEGVENYESKAKVTVIPNMAKIDEFWPREKNNFTIEKLGLKINTFKAVHFGAIGIANGIQSILDSARLLKNDKSIEFVFIGGGAKENELKAQSKLEGLENVHFLGGFPMVETSEIVNFCDVSLVSFLDLPILYTNSPNKLFDSLSAGKPIIVNSAGWTKSLVENSNCGFYVNPKKPNDLVDKLLYLKSNSQLANEMGARSRYLAETKFDKKILCNQFVEVVNKVLK